MLVMTRRTFLKTTAAAGLATSILPVWAAGHSPAPAPLEVHIFSKHLHFLGYESLAAKARELGFAGVDLTVRPDGHVSPERVTRDLPRAIEAMRAEGLRPVMMTTAITMPDQQARNILQTAREAGITHYRTGWIAYPPSGPVPEALEQARRQLAALTHLNQELGMAGAYQNHTGAYLGAAIWDLWQILRDLPPGSLGSQYDVRHATAEGGYAWYNNLRLIAPYINSLAIKDFTWQQTPSGWEAVSVPLGTGMVDFVRYFRLLQSLGIRVPVSLHLEYPLGGADQGNRKLTVEPSVVYAAMQRDLEQVQALWQAAAQ
ncbi:MAG: TIM barrel protein [Bacteroidia bacterium]|nr:TIM barrel protein [Bacteroidia bacterium]